MSTVSKDVRELIGEDKAEKETRTYTISARSDHLDKIEELFSWINSTRSGHSGQAGIAVDGDGSARVTIEKKDGELKKHTEQDIERKNYTVEFSVGLE